jgi:NADH-quinone oxidoreductase subunit J
MPAAATSDAPFAPLVLLALCVVAGVGTVLLLPSRREASLRKVGGVVLLSAGLVLAAILVRWTAAHAAGGMGVYFWLFSSIALVGAVRVVTHTTPVYSALYFVLTVFATAGLFVLLWAEFMAAALVLIYAGAILITYVFVIMLAAEATSGALGGLAEHDAISREPVAACAVGFTLMAVILLVIFDKSQSIARSGGSDSAAVTGATQQLGAYLFRHHLVNLELAGLILTLAMVGAIVIARRRVEPAALERPGMLPIEPTADIVLGPATPINDDPHSIPVVGTLNPRQKEYPET